MTHDIPSQQVGVEQLTDRIARSIESHDRFDCKSGDTYTAAARAIAEDVVSALTPKPEGETVTDDGWARREAALVNLRGHAHDVLEQNGRNKVAVALARSVFAATDKGAIQ